MFGNRRRVDEDLERIRRANLPPDKMAEEEAAEKRGRKNAEAFTAKDIFSATLAAFSVVLPYVAVFVGLLAALYVLLKLWLKF